MSPAFAASIENFDGPIVLSPTQAPGAWYTDRSAPDVFVSGATYGGRTGVLEVGVDGADFRGPNSFPGVPNFSDTEGRKLDLAPGTTNLSIELYIDPAYANGDARRLAGFWGTGVGAGGAVTAYPIIEFFNTGAGGSFRVWDSTAPGSFTAIGLPTGFAYDTWQTLDITLANNQFNYTIGDLNFSVAALGSTSISNVILQAHNAGSDYSVHWDNLSGGAVPEPATWAMMIMGFGFAGATLRRRGRALAKA
ncbi:PEPxxWA-CTERM sorting domain-containing protein [uncultured Phenylobacterium sp.]|uniref:PEPxxWA-CTERM sorting domain-containing protein n=1 Tax=uncultured Phenylobacterium sp. TaxID=349273 RepID=UPI0025ED8967|nr:PEPxxWA-CTERM sorting domain-containing protein [uncultured Phenylobacterium sp.]